jgi:O-antigen ligase/tetratricopeptide (TPR) repeat protein
MASAAAPEAAAHRVRRDGIRQTVVRLLQAGMEAIVLALVVLAPWAFGGVEPEYELVLFTGVAALLSLWTARMLLEWRLRWTKCPVTLCLAALYLGGIWQVTPLPRGVLSWLSPATARMYDQLLPSQPELLPLSEEMPVVNPPPGSTISLYPGATQTTLLRLLAVFLLYVAVRTNIASAAGLRRLSVVALANGMLLALLGVIQFFTSPGHTVYWNYPTEGRVFGPFINRNHFAFYINMCIGLGSGLLLNRYFQLGRARGGWAPAPGRTKGGRPGAGPIHETRMARDPVAQGERRGADWFRSSLSLILDPQVLGISFALAMMLSSVIFCLSRGGILALCGGSIVCVMILLWRSDRSERRWATLLPLGMAMLTLAVMALALVTWFGIAPVAARLATLWDRQNVPGDRLALWARTLPLVRVFPLWGTGYGTFRYLEPLHAADAADAERAYVFAHNDYLETLLEGGLVRLIPSLLAVGLVLRLGYRAIRRYEGRSADGLALGAFFGFTTVAIHSVVEFGLHIPAIALLATVLCAHLCALGGSEGPPAAGRRPAEDNGATGAAGEWVLRLGGLAPLVGAATAVALGLVLIDESWRAARAEPFRRSAARLRQKTDRASRQRFLTDLEAAARLMPEDAHLQVRLAQAHEAIYEDGIQAIEESGRSDDTTRSELEIQQQLPAQQHYLQARDLCPILPEPPLGIAFLYDVLHRAEPRALYLERAQRLAPADPFLWYLYGVEDLLANRPEQAWRSWRRSLELSDRYRPNILDSSARHLAPAEIVRQVVPDRPDILLAAATHLYPSPQATEQRRPFLESALVLLERRPTPLTAADLHLQAAIYSALNRPAEAFTAYRAALAREPLQVDWRFELARLLHQHGRDQEAYDELRTVLGLRPDYGLAIELREAVARRMVEDK